MTRDACAAACTVTARPRGRDPGQRPERRLQYQRDLKPAVAQCQWTGPMPRIAGPLLGHDESGRGGS